MILRPYQLAARDALFSYFYAHDGNPLCVAPTGSGKSVIIADFCRETLTRWPSERILIVTHVKELIEQNAGKLATVWPMAPFGIYSAGVGRRDLGTPVLFAGVQSIFRIAEQIGHYDLVLVDECHLIPHSDEGMYRTLFEGLRRTNPNLKVIGFTATPYRMKGGMLTEGENRLFTDIAYDINVRDLVRDGYLCPLTARGSQVKADLADVRIRAGEFVAEDLERAYADVSEAAIAQVLQRAADRHGWILFCSTVLHANRVTELLNARGIPSATVSGDMDDDARDRAIDGYKAQQLRALCNVNVLTTGFDAPHTDALILMRPTRSPGLHVQMLGRGMRLSPETGKKDCLVLDYAGNVQRHGPIDEIAPPAKAGKRKGGAPGAKECPKCELLLHNSTRQCPECGHEFFRLDDRASSSAVMSEQRQFETHRVEICEATYHRHVKPGGTPTLRVEYNAGLMTYREWVCFEHQGFARSKAISWWMSARASPNSQVPLSVNEALDRAHELRVPHHIKVRLGGKYAEVVSREYANPEALAEPEGTSAQGPRGGDEDRVAAA